MENEFLSHDPGTKKAASESLVDAVLAVARYIRQNAESFVGADSDLLSDSGIDVEISIEMASPRMQPTIRIRSCKESLVVAR